MPSSFLLLALPAALAAAPTPPPPAPADSFMGAGVSQALARWRSARVRDVRYALALDVSGRDTARGRVTVRFTRTGDGDAILDWRGPSLANATANGAPVPGLVANGAHVRVPAAALRPGENALTFDFAARIAPAGASIIRFEDRTDGATYLYTLLVPADANALFPCFDQPDLKARVVLSLTVPLEWTAVANGAATDSSAADGAGATRTFRFAETQPISTYLIAFAAGPWKTVTRQSAAGPMTLYARASRMAEVEVDSLIDANARALEWLGRWFGREYPFGKYDFVLTPAFPFGGMEHPGAVFYNEEQFIFREPPTLPQRLGRTATVYHEVAHQWFGDYVTMRWFDDLWLKEGFSTYMAARMQDALDPTAMAWKTFHLRNKPPAYAVDVTEGTTPVWQQLANLDQAKSNYGAIVYNKAPSVIKQLDYLVGDTAFRAGVRLFLERHAYGNATWRELLGAIGEASGRDLTAWGDAYILRRGMPVLEATPVYDASGRTLRGIRVRQRPAQPDVSGAYAVWPIRTELLVTGSLAGRLPGQTFTRRVPVRLTGRDTVIPVRALVRPGAPLLVYPNARDYAYAVALLDSGSVAWTERHVGAVDDAFERAMLWGSLWDLVREARLAPTRYLALATRSLPTERDEQVASAVLGRLTRATTRYLGDAQRDSVLPGLETMLRAGAADTARVYGIRKAHLDALVQVARTPATLAWLAAALDSTTIAGLPLRAPTRWAIITTLVERAHPAAERRLAIETRRDSTSEGRRRAFVAGAARGDAATKAEYFRRYFADTTLNEDWATASLDAFNAGAHDALTLPYLVPALDSLPWIQRNRRIFFLGSWLDAFLRGQQSPEAVARVDAWLAAHPALAPDLRAKVLQATDDLRRTVRIRQAWVGEAVAAPGVTPRR
jgi:aminopeptidase N